MKLRAFGILIVTLSSLGGCQTVPNGMEQARLAMAQKIQAEPPGDYFIGRRYFKPEFHFWGYVRRPGQPWSAAQLVVLNENRKLAPDREQLNIGSDNNYEYKLRGYFSGDKVYELVSNRFLAEFVLQNYELISTESATHFQKPVPRSAGQSSRGRAARMNQIHARPEQSCLQFVAG